MRVKLTPSCIRAEESRVKIQREATPLFETLDPAMPEASHLCTLSFSLKF